jgi:hypothetical protein
MESRVARISRRTTSGVGDGSGVAVGLAVGDAANVAAVVGEGVGCGSSELQAVSKTPTARQIRRRSMLLS